MPSSQHWKHSSCATHTCCCASSTGCQFVSESTTSWLWWLTTFTTLLHQHVSVVTLSLANQHEHYIHLRACHTFHQDWVCKACFAKFAMLSSICLAQVLGGLVYKTLCIAVHVFLEMTCLPVDQSIDWKECVRVQVEAAGIFLVAVRGASIKNDSRNNGWSRHSFSSVKK